ncbi:MAG: family NAD(P)-dependent oxidoreductase [Verrucomicrobia bacterium]|nr:family NAD(P)-dependent oxidoreductase [Verrucomicrobiota bacterium]
MNIAITGSSSGIGRAITERLLSQGHQVWGLARSLQSDFVAEHHGAFQASRCDVASWPQVSFAAEEIGAAWTRVDALIECAGLQGEVGRTLSADPVNWSATIRANLEGTFNTLRAFDPLLKHAARRAKVICFSGGGSTKPRPNFSAYGVAKTGIVRLVETIAVEESGRAFDINAVAPGGINTRLTDEIIALGPDRAGPTEYAAAQKQKATSGASIENVLGLVDWLLSSASDGISGKLISAQWDEWKDFGTQREKIAQSEVYTLRRITPKAD